MQFPPQLVLASASPRRSELLARLGIRFAVAPSAIPEEPLPGESVVDHVLRLSQEKAREVAARPEVAGRWFLGSDTEVERDGVVLGKPVDAAAAAAMLRSLSGRAHQVVSGYAVYDRVSGEMTAGTVLTKVFFKDLTEVEISGYIASGEPFDKAGAYAIQGLGAFMVRAIDGSYTNVVGLPLCEVVTVLERLGAITLFADPL
ncbi:MAG: septum formation protein Maf [Desulfuromonadales bacterium GWD2_61_12]|nr:MAG: septum formation protein Maf [Desulfuromonadales bacterium GWC2_61_20]OGR35617.1 MAG: septum formation protein Maf [Desulfuromonadales bacterium GWD2_61_12]HAD04399.1 septum formation inhibitor Maf [Desulfuromonas sp.]HBT84195.1 septum formation inhibitor Maf [Desulfuromonas sp.]